MLSAFSLTEIIDKCEIVFENETIPKENLLKAYLDFLLSASNEEEHNIYVTLHMGSLCYDIILLVYLVLYCLYSDDTTANDIVHLLNVDDSVIYEKSRAIFKGFDEKGYAIIYQEIKDHGYISPTISIVPPTRFHKIKPYKGSSKRLDGRGLRTNTTERSKFIKAVLNRSESDISAITQKSVIVLADRTTADSLARGLSIKYNNGKKIIQLTQLITASYFTESEEHRYSGNSGKNTAVLKFMSKASLAREMIIEDEENHIIGLAVMGKDLFDSSKTELATLIKRKSLRFGCVSYPIELDDTKGLIDYYENAKLFACTTQVLKRYSIPENFNGKLTQELKRKIMVASNKKIVPKVIQNTENWEIYDIKNAIFFLKNNCNQDVDIEQFTIYALYLINLFSTAIFPLKEMEKMIDNNTLMCQSPKNVLDLLSGISYKFTGIIAEKMKYIVEKFKEIYSDIYVSNKKFDNLIIMFKYSFLQKRRAIVVPKAYYKDIFQKLLYEKTKRKFNCYIETSTKFNSNQNFDEIIVIGQLCGKRFDVFRNLSAISFTLLQYDFENRQFKFGLKEFQKLENMYNGRMLSILPEAALSLDEESDLDEQKVIDTSLQEFVDNITFQNIIKTATLLKSEEPDAVQAEICKIAKCVNGETVFFTKFFIPYVVNYTDSIVYEGEVSELSPGDILIFNKNNSESQDIVDEVLLGLISRENETSKFLNQQYEYSKHWKEILKKYMSENNLTYKDVSNEMKRNGIQKHEVTLRTWLHEDSHIVGPRDIESYYQIALICNEKKMLDEPKKFYEACNYIRTTRIKILKSLGRAVVKSYMKSDDFDEFYEYVAPKINEISQVVQIETIMDAYDLRIPTYMANKPHYI